MKKSPILLGVLLCILASCSQSIEDKAEKLIKKEMPNNLIIPDSYDPVKTVVDSCFTPFDLQSFNMQVMELDEYMEKVKNIRSDIRMAEYDIDHAESSISLWDDSSTYSRNNRKRAIREREEARERIQEYKNEISKAMEAFDALKKDIKEQIETEPQFLGYKAFHRYRAKNNMDNVLIEDAVFYFDKELTKILNFVTLEKYQSDTDRIQNILEASAKFK